MSPELLLVEGDVRHTLESDIWAWAYTVFEVITDCEPYAKVFREHLVIVSLIREESPRPSGRVSGTRWTHKKVDPFSIPPISDPFFGEKVGPTELIYFVTGALRQAAPYQLSVWKIRDSIEEHQPWRINNLRGANKRLATQVVHAST